VAWGPSPLGRQYRNYWPLAADSRLSAKRQAVSMVPGQAAVAATYYFVPHLTHRPRVYEFPEPWKAVNWGIHGERLHNPAGVRWLILDRSLLTAEDSALLDGLLGGGQFQVRSDRDGILVAQRVAL